MLWCSEELIMVTNLYTTLGLNQDGLALAKPKYKTGAKPKYRLEICCLGCRISPMKSCKATVTYNCCFTCKEYTAQTLGLLQPSFQSVPCPWDSICPVLCG